MELLFDTAEPPEGLCKEARSSAAAAAAAAGKGNGRVKAPPGCSSQCSSSINGDGPDVSSDYEEGDKRQDAAAAAADSAAAATAAAAESAAAATKADAAAASGETDKEETDVEMLSYAQSKARSREAAAAAAAAAAATAATAAAPAAAGTKPAKQEERLLRGRCVFKFLLVSIHSKFYQPPISQWRDFNFESMQHPLWDKDKRLK